MNYKTILSMLAVGFCLSVELRSETYNANQLIEIAIKNNLLIKAAGLDAKSKEEISKQAGAWDNPSIEVGTENKKESGGSTKSLRYGLSQTLYLPGKFSARERISQSEAAMSKLDLTSTELRIRGVVLNLIYEFKASKEKLKHAEERLERFKTVEGFIKSRLFSAPQKKAEASIVAGKLIVLQKDFFHVQAQTNNLWNELNAYLKMSSVPDIQIFWFKKGPELSEQELTSELFANNPDLKKQDIKLTQSKNESELAKIESWPSLTVSGNYSNGTGFSPEKIYGLGVSLPLPVFNTNRSLRAASLTKSNAEGERLNYLKEQATKELRAAFLNYELAKKSVAGLPIKSISDLEKSIGETDRGFKRGHVDLLTFLEADSQHFEGLSAIFESQLDLVKSISDLQTLTGNGQLFLEN
jgi:cobalt-zinc-cadmium efflux system outer membrane protein